MLHQGIEVALPESSASPLPLRTEDPLVLSITADGLVYLKERPVHETRLVEQLQGLLASRGDDSVFLKGDRDVPYGKVVEVLNLLYEGGITQVGMVTEETKLSGTRRSR